MENGAINGLKVLDELKRLLIAALPECKAAYVDFCPKDFERPCVLLVYAERTDEPANAGTVRRAHKYAITYFDVTGEHHESDTRRLLEARERIMNLFEAGYIRVEDRAPCVKAKTTPRNDDTATVEVTVSYNEALPQGTEPPVMEKLNLNLKEDY